MDKKVKIKVIKGEGVKKVKKVLKVVSGSFFFLGFLLLGAVVFLALQSKATGKVPSIGGYQVYSITGGSMEPNIQRGSAVLVKRVDTNKLEAGDVITFIDVADRKTVVTHRIVKVKPGKENSFVTRGDANNDNDTDLVPAEHVIGQVKLVVPFAGYLMSFAKTREGLIFLIIIPGVLIILFELLSLRKELIHLKNQKTQKLLAKMKESLIKEAAQGGSEGM